MARDTHLIRFRCSAMKASDNPQAWFWPRIAEHRGVNQPLQHCGQIEPAIEVVRRRDGVASGIIAPLDGRIVPTRGALDVGQYPIDPARSGRSAVSLATVAFTAEASVVNCTRPPKRRGASRSAMASMALCVIGHAALQAAFR